MSFVSGTVSGILGSQAAGEQADAARYSADIQYKMYKQSRKDLMPSLKMQRRREFDALNMFHSAIKTIQEGPGEYETSEAYKFAQKEGEQAIQRASGLYGGGSRAIKEAQRYGKGLLSQDRAQWLNEYQQKIGNLLAVAQGPGATSNVGPTLAASSASAGRGIGEAYQDVGAAKASDKLNTANIINQGSQVAQQVGMRYLANKYPDKFGWLTK